MPDRAWRHRLVRGAAAMAVIAVAFAVPSTTAAQQAAPSGVVARPGELVRVRTAQWEYTGILARVANDTADIRFASDSVRVPSSVILGAKVQRGTRRSVPRIMLISAAGAAGGTLIGALAGARLECGSSCGDSGDYEGLAGGAAGASIGLLAGAIAGGIWGAKKRYPRWVQAVIVETR